MKLQFNVSWEYVNPNNVPLSNVGKRSDAKNKNMYVTDNMGNQYDHIAVGDAAAKTIGMSPNQPVFGWFLFPQPRPGGIILTFHDDDNKITISRIILASR